MGESLYCFPHGNGGYQLTVDKTEKRCQSVISAIDEAARKKPQKQIRCNPYGTGLPAHIKNLKRFKKILLCSKSI